VITDIDRMPPKNLAKSIESSSSSNLYRKKVQKASVSSRNLTDETPVPRINQTAGEARNSEKTAASEEEPRPPNSKFSGKRARIRGMFQNEADYAGTRRAYQIKEAAAAYRLSRTTLYKLIATGALRSVKICGRRLIPVDAIEDLISGGGP
jgi:excisionase family DNA binding protein